MESSLGRPSAAESARVLRSAESARQALAARVAPPPGFALTLGLTIAIQIATMAIGVGTDRPWVAIAGLAFFAAAAAAHPSWFRMTNGVRLGGFASRVVLGTGPLASVTYMASLGAAIWAGLEDRGWLLAIAAAAGGIAYPLCGALWLRAYRAQPATLARGESGLALIVLAIAALAGLALLLLTR